ncbi:MAG: hypothetical protein ACRC4G_01165 [Alphaproteobacteria bacterium]
MLFSYKLKQVALGVVLSSCSVSSCALASGDSVSALDEGEVAEKAISLRVAPSVSEEQLSAPSPLASIFSSGSHKNIFGIIAKYLDWKSLFQLRGVRKDFQSQIVVLGKNATPEAIEKAKQTSFVAVICEERRSPADIPESLKQTFSWPNLLVLEGGIKPTDFTTLSTSLRMLSLKSHTIWSDQAMGLLQTWLDRTTHLESLNLPYCLVGPTVYGISQSATEPKATEAATFVSHLPRTLRHLNLSGNRDMGGHEIVNSLLRALSQSPVPLMSLNLGGRSVIGPGALTSSLTSLTMNVPFYMSAEKIQPLQLPQGLEQLCLLSSVSHNLKDVLNYIPESNVIKRLSVPLKSEKDLSNLLDALQSSPSLAAVRFLAFDFNILKDKEMKPSLSKLAETQLVSLDLRQCFNLSEGYKDELRASLFCNRMDEKIEIKL